MTTADGAHMPAMTFAAAAIHAKGDLAGWVAYVIYGIVIGALFGWLLSRYEMGMGSGLLWGGFYGALWWIASILIIIPVLRGVAPFTRAAIVLVHGAVFAW